MCKREICSRVVVAKQGILEEFWFKPYTGNFSRKKFTKEYVQKQHTFRSIALDKQRTFYKPLDQKIRN
jgi:hypothetical protein